MSADPSVVKVPPEATVTLPAPLIWELPLAPDSRVRVPPLSTVLAAPIDRSMLPPAPSATTPCVPLEAPPT